MKTALTRMSPGSRKDLLLLALSLALQMSGNALILTTTSLVGERISPDPSLATLPLAIQFLVTMLTTIPASLFMGRNGRKTGFMLGASIALASGVLATFAIIHAHFVLYCIAAAGIGVFNGFAVYYRFAATEVVDEAHKAQAISLVLAGGVVAAVIGPNVANWTRELVPAADFAGGYLAISGFYLLSILMLSSVSFRAPVVTDFSHGRPLKVIAAQGKFIVAVLCGMLGYAVMSLVMTATPLAMKHHAHVFSDTAFVIQWHVLGMFAPSFITGALITRFGLNNIMLTGGILGVICVLINLAGQTVWHFWVALFCLGVSWNFLYIGATDLLTETYRDAEKSRAQALNDFAVFTSVTTASLTAGYLQHRFGWQMVNVGVLPLLAVIIGALLWLRFNGQKVGELTTK